MSSRQRVRFAAFALAVAGFTAFLIVGIAEGRPIWQLALRVLLIAGVVGWAWRTVRTPGHL